jgi:hypothetical protein
MPTLPSLIPILWILVGAGFGLGVSYKYLFWFVPRRKILAPSIVTALTGSFLIGWGGTRLIPVTGVPEIISLIVLGFVGTLLALFAAVKIGTPGHATVTVVCNGFGVPNDGSLNMDDKRQGRIRKWMRGRKIDYKDPPPTVWPETFWVSQEGSVSWILFGEQGTQVTIEFNKDYDPFRTDGDGPSKFSGIIPPPPSGWRGQFAGLVVAAPVVRAGRGDYKITVAYPGGRGVATIDPGGGSPTRRG